MAYPHIFGLLPLAAPTNRPVKEVPPDSPPLSPNNIESPTFTFMLCTIAQVKSVNEEICEFSVLLTYSAQRSENQPCVCV